MGILNIKSKHAITSCLQCESRGESALCSLGQAHFEQLESNKTTLVYKKGSTLFQEGSHANGVYCIQEGKVKLTKTGDQGREQILRLVKTGDLLGYRSVFGDRMSTTAVALEDSTVCFIPKDAFLNALREAPEFSMDLFRLLSADLKRSDEYLMHLAQKPVRERTAEALILLYDTYGTLPDGKTLDVQLSRDEIANMIGTAMETAVRFLNEFKRDGIIDLSGKRIRILNREELAKVANMYD